MQYAIQCERLQTNSTNTNHFEEKEEGGEEDDSVGGGDGDSWGVTGLATGGWTHRYYGLCKHTFTQCNDHYSISTAIKTSTFQQSFPASSIWFWTIFSSFGKKTDSMINYNCFWIDHSFYRFAIKQIMFIEFLYCYYKPLLCGSLNLLHNICNVFIKIFITRNQKYTHKILLC